MDEWMKEKVVDLINGKLINELIDENNIWMNWYEVNQWMNVRNNKKVRWTF